MMTPLGLRPSGGALYEAVVVRPDFRQRPYRAEK